MHASLEIKELPAIIICSIGLSREGGRYGGFKASSLDKATGGLLLVCKPEQF